MTLADSYDDLPEQLQNFNDDPASGLIAVRPGSPDGVIPYTSVDRAHGHAAIEIPHGNPHLVDESDLPGGSPPPMTFEELVDKHGCAFLVWENRMTYVYVPGGADE